MRGSVAEIRGTMHKDQERDGKRIKMKRETIARETERKGEKQRALRERASERRDSRGCWTMVGRLSSSPSWREMTARYRGSDRTRRTLLLRGRIAREKERGRARRGNSKGKLNVCKLNVFRTLFSARL